jgi:hypothetical protein
MMGRITRLIDHQQYGAITAEDGSDYEFQSLALFQCKFGDLSLGAIVSFEPIVAPKRTLRASAVRLVLK